MFTEKYCKEKIKALSNKLLRGGDKLSVKIKSETLVKNLSKQVKHDVLKEVTNFFRENFKEGDMMSLNVVLEIIEKNF